MYDLGEYDLGGPFQCTIPMSQLIVPQVKLASFKLIILINDDKSNLQIPKN